MPAGRWLLWVGGGFLTSYRIAYFGMVVNRGNGLNRGILENWFLGRRRLVGAGEIAVGARRTGLRPDVHQYIRGIAAGAGMTGFRPGIHQCIKGIPADAGMTGLRPGIHQCIRGIPAGAGMTVREGLALVVWGEGRFRLAPE